MVTARLDGFPPQIGFFAFLAGSLAFAAHRFLSSGADSTIAPIFAGALALLTARGSPQFLALASFLALIVGAILVLERVPGTSIWWPCGGDAAGERLTGVLVAGFQAPLSFLNASGFQRELRDAIKASAPRPKLVVLEAGNIVVVDYTAAAVLARTIMDCRAAGADVALARLESVRAKEALERFGVIKILGEARLFRSVDEATRTLAPEVGVIGL